MVQLRSPLALSGVEVPNVKFQIVKHKFCHLSFVIWILFVICALSFVICMTGCDAFVRKFTRKPKTENLPQEEMVLVPEEYKGPQVPKEELYRQYFLFWKSWHDELIESLLQKKSQKKQIDCAEEAIKNLINLQKLLNEEQQKKLDIYILQLKDLQEAIGKDLYGMDSSNNVQNAERIKRSLLREFSYNKVKDCLI